MYYNSNIFDVINNKDIAGFDYVLSRSNNINQRNRYFETPLHVAINKGLYFVEKLLSMGADVNAISDNNMSALHRAVTINLDIVKLLVDSGAVINVINSYGIRPIDIAANTGKYDIVRYLIDHGAIIGENQVSQYVITKSVDYLLKDYPDLDFCYSDGETMLHRVAEKGYLDIVKIVIDYIDINSTFTNLGWTPLMCAIRYKKIETIEYLLDHGADPNICETFTGRSPLGVAIYNDLPLDIIKKIIACDADLTIRTNKGHNILHYTRFKCNPDTVKYLVDLFNGIDRQYVIDFCIELLKSNHIDLANMITEYLKYDQDIIDYIIEKSRT
jgi:ankyrin repeat protein